WCDGLVGSTTSRWAFLILAPRSYWTVLPKLREQRIDVLERHAAPSLEKSRSISVSPETNQSFVSGMPHIPRNSSRTRSNSLGACCTNPKVRAGDLKLKIFLLSPRRPASHESPADKEDLDFASGRPSILLNDEAESRSESVV